MPQIVEANIVKSGTIPDSTPGVVQVREMRPGVLPRDDPGVVVIAGQGGEHVDGCRGEGDDVSTGLGVGQVQLTSVEIDMCQGRRETRPKGGAKHCRRGRRGEMVRGGRDETGGGVSRKRREGVARAQFPGGGDAQIRS